MKDRRIGLKFLIPLFIILIVAEYLIYTGEIDKGEPVRQISLIVYGSDASRWESLKQGAELAAKEHNAEITMITMSSENDVREQTSLIDREVKNGSDALLIASCDSAGVDEYILSKKYKTPYLYVESGAAGSGDDLICVDNEEMGRSLATLIHDNEKDWIKVAVIADNMSRENVKLRLQGLMEKPEEYADEVVLWERNEQEKDTKTMLFLQRELTEEAVDVVVALDDSSMDALLDATINLNKDIKIYGIANDEKAVYYLDNRVIKGLVYQDEFSMGYLGVKKLLSEGKSVEKGVDYLVVKREDIYQDENQKILFPLVK